VLFLDDAAYVDGPIWAAVSPIHALTAAIAVLMTMVVLIPVVSKAKTSIGRVVTLESSLLISLYVIASLLVFYSGRGGH
ncbi:uncharacterized protein METZ01_LOCUS388054, partial [marine metagenome]